MRRTVVVTIDDLPFVGAAKDGDHRASIAQLCSTLKKFRVPAVGFVNMGKHDKDPELMEAWRACGITLGNHTWSHPKLGRVDLPTYLDDLERGHHALEKFAPDQVGGQMYFRYPFLFQGFDPKARQVVRDKLRELGARHAPVTIDTSDWLYASGYAKARASDDSAAMARYHTSWSWNLQEATFQSETLADELFDGAPPQILLLHANALAAEHLHEYLDWLIRRGYEFVDLATALAHPAYSESDESWSPTGDSHWLRLRRSRSLRAGGVAGWADLDER